MRKSQAPIETVKIGRASNPDAIFFRFAKGITRRSVQPDPKYFVFLELDREGRLLGVLTYERVNILVIESCEPDLIIDGLGQPEAVGSRWRYKYEARFDKLIEERVRLDVSACPA
jgi:hypothetical protein